MCAEFDWAFLVSDYDALWEHLFLKINKKKLVCYLYIEDSHVITCNREVLMPLTITLDGKKATCAHNVLYTVQRQKVLEISLVGKRPLS
eukprot:c29378_g1_i1 orf=2-265(-)